jgi:hypothetical protein
MVEPVDILGKHTYTREYLFGKGYHFVGTIVSGPTAPLFDLTKVFPGNIRPGTQRFSRQSIFYRNPILRILPVIQSAYPAIRRKARIRGYPGPGNEQYTAGASHRLYCL